MNHQNFDYVSNNADMLAHLLQVATGNGKFPASKIGSFDAGGANYNVVRQHLALYPNKGAVYVSRDKHFTIYGVHLVTFVNALPAATQQTAGQLLSSNYINSYDGSVWNRATVGGAYRRAKTAVRVHKSVAKGEANAAAMADAGAPQNIVTDPKFKNREGGKNQFNTIVF